MDPNTPRIIALVGPTAVGKTDLSIMLAQRFGGEIVNADSRLFYRGMDIGTAKPTGAQQSAVRHHLIDILHPNEPASLATFQDLAISAIGDIIARGKTPFVVGGTPQYINALLEGWQIPRIEPDPELRAQLESRERLAPGSLLAELRAVDPVSADKHGANTRRVIRALEVWYATGIPISLLQRRGPRPFHALELELWRPRTEMYQRIDARARDQIAGGLVDEVRALLSSGVSRGASSFGAIGYRQVLPLVDGTATESEVIQRLQFDCHRLVRKQDTWWRKNPHLIRVDLTQSDASDQLTSLIAAHLA